MNGFTYDFFNRNTRKLKIRLSPFLSACKPFPIATARRWIAIADLPPSRKWNLLGLASPPAKQRGLAQSTGCAGPPEGGAGKAVGTQETRRCITVGGRGFNPAEKSVGEPTSDCAALQFAEKVPNHLPQGLKPTDQTMLMSELKLRPPIGGAFSATCLPAQVFVVGCSLITTHYSLIIAFLIANPRLEFDLSHLQPTTSKFLIGSKQGGAAAQKQRESEEPAGCRRYDGQEQVKGGRVEPRPNKAASLRLCSGHASRPSTSLRTSRTPERQRRREILRPRRRPQNDDGSARAPIGTCPSGRRGLALPGKATARARAGKMPAPLGTARDSHRLWLLQRHGAKTPIGRPFGEAQGKLAFPGKIRRRGLSGCRGRRCGT